MKDIVVAKKMLSIEQSAKSRGLDFDLDFYEVKRLLLAKRCYYTGVILNDDTGSPNKLSFDRIDNSKGYVHGNVVACAEKFNQLKANLYVKDIVLLYKGLKRKKLV